MREMKDSNNQWIKEVPSDYRISKFKYISSLYTGNSIKDNEKDNYTDSVNARPYLSSKDIEANYSTANYDNGMYVKKNDNSFKVARKGSTLMCIEGGSAGRKKTLLCEDVTFVNKLCCFDGKEDIEDRYLYYYLYNPAYVDEFNNNITGMIGGVSVSTLNNINICVPSFSEQKNIADFLDSKCSQIDEISKKIQEEIDTLEEYKKSVITEAVTKGLDPNVEMKDSGVEWIGKLPTSWSISKLGNVLRLRTEKNNKPLEEVNLISLYTDKGVVQHDDLEETTGNKAQKAEGYKIVHKNDIVVNIILAWMGAMGISAYDGVTSPAYDVYEINTNKIVPHYCHYILRTPSLAGECYKYGRGIMMMRWRTYSTEFKKIKMPLPSLKEQKEIADFLDQKCSEIDLVILKKQQQLSTLDEYKKSLIYEYVTGKKEVLNANS